MQTPFPKICSCIIIVRKPCDAQASFALGMSQRVKRMEKIKMTQTILMKIEDPAYRTILILAALLAFVLLLWAALKTGGRFGRTRTVEDMDEMDGLAFEKFCARLLEKRDFEEVQVTSSSGDFGIDILAEKEGVTYAIQCKCYTEPVGVAAIQQACAGREYYDRMVGAVMTNQYFTEPAKKAAKKCKILLWDRDKLEEML